MPGRQLLLTATAILCSTPVSVLTVATVSNVNAGAAISLSGTYANGNPTNLQYSASAGASGSFVDATTPVFTPSGVSSGTWSFTIGAGLPAGVYALVILDPFSGGRVTTNIFVVAAVGAPSLPVLSNPIFGYDASVASGHLFEDTGGATQATIGGKVRRITDLSGAGNHYTQATIGKAPMFVANAKNGLPGLVFDDLQSQVMSLISGASILTTMKASTGFTFLIVWQADVLPGSGATAMAFNESALAGGYNIIRPGQILSSGNVRASRNSNVAYFQPTVPSVATAGGLLRQVTRYDGTNIRTIVNASSEVAVPGSSLGANAFTISTIGAEVGGGVEQLHLDGKIMEIRGWNTAADDTARTALLAYATAKWGT